MVELVKTLASILVDNKDEVKVTEVVEGDTLTLELRVAKAEVGKIIGASYMVAG